MQQEHFERSFSRRKHLHGGWRTSFIPAMGPLLRRAATTISFKHRELDTFARRCFPFYIVVDSGAGIGAYSHFFLRRCPATVVAVDWSSEALRKIPSPRRGTLLRVCADSHCLPIKPACIDALFTIDTLGHLRCQERALDEINRVCRSGAALFLHSECSDYRRRWPDRRLIDTTEADPIAALDGHFGIRTANEMRALYEQRFSVSGFFSPGGIFGWLLGYPEKYFLILWRARMYLPALCAGMAALLRNIPGMKPVFRTINMVTNSLELFLGIEGGGSCFAQGRTLVPQPHVSGSRWPAIDIIIPTYRRAHLLPAAVDALVSQCTGADRIFIVRQDERPGEPPLDRGGRVHVLHLARPNLPAARNTGLAAGGNAIVLYLDDDCAIEPGLLDAHRFCYTDPSTGAAGGFVDDPLFPPGASVPSFFDITTGELVQRFSLEQSCASISVMGANMSFGRTALESIGGFDPHFRHNALWEEIDASFRLQQAGYAIRYCAGARVKHHRHPEGGCRSDVPSRHLYHMFANTAYFACSYAPVKNVRAWIRFWKYRLEYLSRSNGGDNSPKGKHDARLVHKRKHEARLVIAGLRGALAGCVRFYLAGKRVGLPRPVIELYERQRGSRQ